MITYENENARLLIEGKVINLTPIIEKINLQGKIYITEEAALKFYNTYHKKEISQITIIVDNKPVIVVPMVKMKMI